MCNWWLGVDRVWWLEAREKLQGARLTQGNHPSSPHALSGHLTSAGEKWVRGLVTDSSSCPFLCHHQAGEEWEGPGGGREFPSEPEDELLWSECWGDHLLSLCRGQIGRIGSRGYFYTLFFVFCVKKQEAVMKKSELAKDILFSTFIKVFAFLKKSIICVCGLYNFAYNWLGSGGCVPHSQVFPALWQAEGSQAMGSCGHSVLTLPQLNFLNLSPLSRYWRWTGWIYGSF